MLSQETQAHLAGQLRTMRIIVAAMTGGLMMFLGFAFFKRAGEANPPADAVPVLTYGAVGFAVLATVARFVLPNLVAAAARKNIAGGEWQGGSETGAESAQLRELFEKTGDVGRLCWAYQMRLIIGAALFEAPGFFAIFAYMTEGEILALVAAALLIVGVVCSFPTSSRLEHWIDEQLLALEEERRLAR